MWRKKPHQHHVMLFFLQGQGNSGESMSSSDRHPSSGSGEVTSPLSQGEVIRQDSGAHVTDWHSPSGHTSTRGEPVGGPATGQCGGGGCGQAVRSGQGQSMGQSSSGQFLQVDGNKDSHRRLWPRGRSHTMGKPREIMFFSLYIFFSVKISVFI